jgi:hypothetical protein
MLLFMFSSLEEYQVKPRDPIGSVCGTHTDLAQEGYGSCHVTGVSSHLYALRKRYRSLETQTGRTHYHQLVERIATSRTLLVGEHHMLKLGSGLSIVIHGSCIKVICSAKLSCKPYKHARSLASLCRPPLLTGFPYSDVIYCSLCKKD